MKKLVMHIHHNAAAMHPWLEPQQSALCELFQENLLHKSNWLFWSSNPSTELPFSFIIVFPHMWQSHFTLLWRKCWLTFCSTLINLLLRNSLFALWQQRRQGVDCPLETKGHRALSEIRRQVTSKYVVWLKLLSVHPSWFTCSIEHKIASKHTL